MSDGQCVPITAASYKDASGLSIVFPLNITGGGKIHTMLLDINRYKDPILVGKKGPDKHFTKLARHQHAFRKSWINSPSKREANFHKLLTIILKIKNKAPDDLPFDFNYFGVEFAMVIYLVCLYMQLI
jgi:hypothetical protein